MCEYDKEITHLNNVIDDLERQFKKSQQSYNFVNDLCSVAFKHGINLDNVDNDVFDFLVKCDNYSTTNHARYESPVTTKKEQQIITAIDTMRKIVEGYVYPSNNYHTKAFVCTEYSSMLYEIMAFYVDVKSKMSVSEQDLFSMRSQINGYIRKKIELLKQKDNYLNQHKKTQNNNVDVNSRKKTKTK